MSPIPLSRAARALVLAELPIVLAMAPALLFPTPRRLAVLLLIPVVWGCARAASRQLVPPTPMNAPLWLLLVMTGVSLFATFDVRASLGKVSGVLLGALLFWAVCRWLTTPGRLRLATLAFLLAGGVLAGLGLAGTSWFDKFPVLGGIAARLPRMIRGVPGAEEGFHPNAVAGCLVLFVPLQVTLLVSPQARRWFPPPGWNRAASRWLLPLQVGLLGLTLAMLALSQSRGAWAALAVAGVAFLGWHSSATRRVAVLAVVGGVVAALATGPARVLNLAISQSGPGMAGNVAGRVELWSRALDGIRDFPFTGMGMNTFRTVMPALYPTFLTSPDFDVAHAHNHLLQVGLDLGIPGLVAYGAIWLLVAWLLAAVYRRAGDPACRALAGGLGAGLIAHFVFSLTDAIPLGAKVGVLFWLTLALAVALHRVALQAGSGRISAPHGTE